MKKIEITRKQAIEMFRLLSNITMTQLDEDTLTAVLSNFKALAQVNDEHVKLSDELARRLYGEADVERKKEFFKVLAKYEREKDASKRLEYESIMEESYGDFYPLYKKQITVLTKLYFKEVEIDLIEVDQMSFMKGVALGKCGMSIKEVTSVFAPMFIAPEVNVDMSELDSLLAE